MRDVALFVDYLLRSASRSTLIMLGVTDAMAFESITGVHKIKVEHDFTGLEYRGGPDTVVLAVDVIDRFRILNPVSKLLKDAYEAGSIVVTTAPDMLVRRPQTQDLNQCGSHPERSSLIEHCAALEGLGLPVDFSARTRVDIAPRQPGRIVTIHDPQLGRARQNARLRQRPLCLISMFNENDVAAYVVRHFVEQGCDVHVIDNWSTDGTFEIVLSLAVDPRVTCERFPPEGPHDRCEWRSILGRKEQIAFEHSGRWVIHADADELLYAPWPAVPLIEALAVATGYGANRVDFTMLSFPPVTEAFKPGSNLQQSFRYFEYGSDPGHYLLKRAWHQGAVRIDLASHGGHVANFDGAIDFPYKFLMKHYPIRSTEHGRRKVFQERWARWSQHERDILQWHGHYEGIEEGSSFLRNHEELHDAHSGSLLNNFGLFIISDLAERRFSASRKVPTNSWDQRASP